jgi:small-conductance mechanosensitive channel
VGLGFGLQKVVSNFVSGIILLMEKSVKPGDVIAIEDGYGWVQSLGARYVSVLTRDGIEHIIPNEDFITQKVENWSFSDNNLRLKIPVGVSYNCDLELAIKLCIEAANGEERVKNKTATVCLIKGFGDNSVDLELRFWIDDPSAGCANIQSKVYLSIWHKFKEHSIEIPYPQRDLHIRTAIPLTVGSATPDKKKA